MKQPTTKSTSAKSPSVKHSDSTANATSKSYSNSDSVSAAEDEQVTKTRGAVTGLAGVLRESAKNASGDGKEREALAQSVSGWLTLIDNKRSAVTDEAKVQWHLGLLDLKERVHALDESFSDLKNEIRTKVPSEATKAKLDHARVQAHLAKMDGADAVSARRQEMKSAWHSEKAAASKTFDDIVKTIEGWTSNA